MIKNSNQKGFIALMMFVMLTLCATMVSLFLTRGTIYRYSVNSFLSEQKINWQLKSALAVAQSFLNIDISSTQTDPAQADLSGENDAKMLVKMLLGRTQRVTSEMFGEEPGIIIEGSIQPESGKININALYDFTNKKFINEGATNGDRKKFAEWLFNKIAQETGGASLFGVFSEYLKNRAYPLHDVTELLLIPEFASYFEEALFLEVEEKNKPIKKLYLMDLFTVSSETDTIQPWFLSSTLIKLLGGQAVTLDEEMLEKLRQNFALTMDWEKKWDETIAVLYDIKFDNLAEEVKSMLTQQFEVTIFSITLRMHDKKNKAGLYSLLKKKTEKNALNTYDIIKIYQI
jgi:hypothetical protein